VAAVVKTAISSFVWPLKLQKSRGDTSKTEGAGCALLPNTVVAAQKAILREYGKLYQDYTLTQL